MWTPFPRGPQSPSLNPLPPPLQVGPKPNKPLGVIVKFKEGVVAAAASGTGDTQLLNAGLNLYKLTIKDGSTPKVKAAQLEKLNGE